MNGDLSKFAPLFQKTNMDLDKQDLFFNQR
jgi:hypothetical protein